MDDSATLDPATYAHWRDTTLGKITEEIELRLVFDLAGPLRGRQVLDVGTGDGAYAIEAAVRGGDVVALDPSRAMLEAARLRAAERGVSLQLREGSVERLPFEAERFDVVFAVTVLCFVGDTNAAFREIARVVAPGGRVIVGELGRWSLWAAKRRLQSLGRRTLWRAADFSSVRELKQGLTAVGLRIEAARGGVYFPPIATAARIMAPIDRTLARFGTVGAAFVCTVARKP